MTPRSLLPGVAGLTGCGFDRGYRQMDSVRNPQIPPQDFEALRAAIWERRDSLPKRIRQIAVYALDHPDEMAFRTVASLAEASEVQPSTLVRFAQFFGYDGFSSLQQVFRLRLKSRVPSYEDRLRKLAAEDVAQSGMRGLLEGAIDAAHRSLETLRLAADTARLEKATAILANARTIYVIAKRRSYPIGSYMAYAFGKLRIRCVLVGSAAGIDDDILALADQNDAAFAVSFSPYAPETAAQVAALAERAVPIVSLTDSAFSPLAASSTLWFELAEADHAGFRSLSASMAFAMALTVAVAECRRAAMPE